MPPEFGDSRLTERFWQKVAVQGDGCWVWTAYKNRDGYGKITYRGELFSAHRLIYASLVAPVPTGLHLDHLCRVRHCVNPAHLEPVTSGENTRRSPIHAAQMVLNGRRCAGEGHGSAKLSDSAAREIFRLRADGWSLKDLGSRFGTSEGNVSALLLRKTWKHLHDQAPLRSNISRKLSPETVEEMRRLKAEGQKVVRLAERFGVSSKYASYLLSGAEAKRRERRSKSPEQTV